MEIVESLQDRVPETGEFQRVVVVSPETGDCHVSVVIVRIPAGRQFPLHIHPQSEDCFFVLSGSGEVIEPGRSIPICAPAGVWIPPGHPHGLATGSVGILEVGFQAPPDPTVIPLESDRSPSSERGLLVQPIPTSFTSEQTQAEWVAVFPTWPHKRYLDSYYAVLRSSERLIAEAQDFELVVIVATGAIELTNRVGRQLGAVGSLRISPGQSVEVCALQSSTLLLGIRAYQSV